MPTYNEIVNGHNPFVLMQSNGSSIVDQSANDYSLVPGTSGYTADLIGFRKTDSEHGWRSDDFANGTSIPYFAHTPTSNLFTVSFWIYRPTTGDGRMVTSFGQAKCTVWTNSGLFGVNSFSGDIAGFSESLILDNKWHHVAFVFDSNDVANTTRGWLDGVEQILTFVGTPNARPVTGVSQRFLITGGFPGSGGEQYQDTISTVHSLAWFNSILTETQIQEQANHNFGEEINAHAGYVWDKKPFAHWKMWDDDPVGKIIDQSLNANHMTLSGTYLNTAGGLPNETGGAHIDINPTGYAESDNTGTQWDTIGFIEYSVESWIQFDALPPSTSSVLGFGNGAGIHSSLQIRDDMQTVRWEVWIGSSSYPLIFDYELGKLYHFVFTQATDGRRFYVNGELIGFTSTLTPPNAASDRFYLNRNAWESQSRNAVDYYEVAVYNDVALSATEVQQHYQAGNGSLNGEPNYENTVKALSPIAYYPCNVESLTSDTLFDVVGSRHITLPAGGSIVDNQLNGQNAYRHNQANVSPVLLPTAGQTALSIEFWMKLDGRPSLQYDVFMGLVNGGTRFDYHSDSNVNIGTRVYNNLSGGDYGTNNNMGELHKLDKWYHIVLNIDTIGLSVETWVDGVHSLTTPVDSGALTDMNLIIGNLSTNAFPANATYQHIAVYPNVLTEAQIKNHYRLRMPLPTGLGHLESSIVADEPVSYWVMDEQTGSTLTDIMRGTNGTLQNDSADVLTATGINRYQDPVQSCIEFNSSAWVDVGDITWYSNNPFTVEMLCEFTELSATNTIIGLAEGSGFRFDKVGANLRFRCVDSGLATFVSYTSTIALETNKLYHIVITFDGQFVTVYANGVVHINQDLGVGYDFNFNTYNKLVFGAQWNISGSHDSFADEKLAHIAWYDKVVPTANWMARTRLVHGDVSAFASTPYQDVVIFDQPLVYYPLNDVHANYPSQFSDVGNSDTDTRIAVLDNSGDHFGYETAEIVVGGGGCLDIDNVANSTNQLILKDEAILSSFLNDITIELWFELDAVGDSRFVSCNNSGFETEGTNALFALDILPDTSIRLLWEYGAGNNEFGILFPIGTLSTGTVYHLVAVRNAATNEMYGFLNGVKGTVIPYTNQTSVGATPDADNRLRIGGDNTAQAGLNGRLSHVAIYDKVLTDQQVDDHYQAGIGNPVGAIREVNGIVTERDVPVSRKVFIYDRADGSYITETTSSAVDGTFSVQWRNPDPLKRYMVIVQDDDLGDAFEPIARDNIEAVDV